MEKSGFFNAMKVGDKWDRVYKAENFAEYFSTFIGNGVFPNPATGLQVVETDKMQVILRGGKAWINGFIYINTDNLVFNVDVGDGVLNRIDKVVLRYDIAKREIRACIKRGEFNSNPTAPILTRNADIYELGLADISINAGAVRISQADITDLRFNKTMCGIVHATVEQIDSTIIFNQFQDWYKEKQKNYDKDVSTWTQQKKQDFEKWYEENIEKFTQQFNNFYDNSNNKFNEWFDSLKTRLDKNIVTKLNKDIENIKKDLNTTMKIKSLEKIDLNDCNKIGIYTVKDPTANAPKNFNNHLGYDSCFSLIVTSSENNIYYCEQIAIQQKSCRTFKRAKSNDDWSEWIELLTENDIGKIKTDDNEIYKWGVKNGNIYLEEV